ncbi:YgfZ/GcvT domain-containing protein [Hydrocarboniphaga sp.]|uniref:CAF17-like 4Fe-4S cluster assembly/insertion protein YgfZ n=1 Tax=Hydrocarboniphaga sp. TaxID=2033016 RepID=UPI003D0B59F4
MSSPYSLVDLAPDWSLLRAAGSDTDSFLQGQLGNDLRKLSAECAQISSYSSPKGRMLAAMTLSRAADGAVDIELPAVLAEPIAKRLRLFVLRSKVKVETSPDALLGLRGAGAAAALTAAGLPVPEQAMQMAEADGVRVLRRFGALPRYSLLAARDRLDALAAAWTDADRLGADAWRLDDVLAGVTTVLPQTQDHFVAQMANLDRLGGISFDKGCYTGQEIVARLHYLGQLKRRMFLCRGAGAPPEPGSAVHDGGEAQAVGEIALSAAEGDGFAAAVVLQIGQAQSASLRVGDVALSVPQAYEY